VLVQQLDFETINSSDDERAALQLALGRFRHCELVQTFPKLGEAADRLLVKLARTKCSEQGCEYCDPEASREYVEGSE
jgi:hypothetical protein